MLNPFTYCVNKLVNIVTGQVVPEAARESILMAFSKGTTIADTFVEERLRSRTVDFHAPVKQVRLPKFSANKHPLASREKTQELKVSRDLLSRVLLVARDRNLDLRELLAHNLTQYPPSLSCSGGSIQRTTKSSLMHYFEAQVQGSRVQQPPSGGAIIIDGMALIQELADKVPPTLGDLSVFVLSHVLKLATFYSAKRVDFVCDRYFDFSIKNAERNTRAGGTNQGVQRALSACQKTPSPFRRFLMSGKSKESLCTFLAFHWRSLSGNELAEKTVYVTVGRECFAMAADSKGTAVVTVPVAELDCDHEEADTRLLLHAKHASDLHTSVVIKSPDTDVFLLCAANAALCSSNMFFSTGTGNASRLLHVNLIMETFGHVAEALTGFHAFTGCDSTSSLKGKGKIKPFQLMISSPHHLETFSQLGKTWELTEQQLENLEAFVCCLYGQSTKSVNEARHNIFRLTCKTDHNLPPNKDSLNLQSQRANYQAAIWRRCLLPSISAPSPLEHGWEINSETEQNCMTVKWMSTQPAHSSLVQLVKCGCKKENCSSNKCRCRSAGMPCTGLCQCCQCENKVSLAISENDSGTDSDCESVDSFDGHLQSTE